VPDDREKQQRHHEEWIEDQREHLQPAPRKRNDTDADPTGYHGCQQEQQLESLRNELWEAFENNRDGNQQRRDRQTYRKR